MNAMQDDRQHRGTHPAKDKQITNNPDGTSTVTFPKGTGGNTTKVVQQFSGTDGGGMLESQLTDFKNGTSQEFIDDPAALAKFGAVGNLFGVGDVTNQIRSVDFSFSHRDGKGEVTSGDVELKTGETYAFKTAGIPHNELLSVSEFTGPGATGALEGKIIINKDGSAEIKSFGEYGSDSSKGVVSSTEKFNTNAQLTTEVMKMSNGTSVVDRFHYDSTGKEVSETVLSINRNGHVVSSVTMPPSGQPLPSFGGAQLVAALKMALASLSPAGGAGMGAAAMSNMTHAKTTLAASAR